MGKTPNILLETLFPMIERHFERHLTSAEGQADLHTTIQTLRELHPGQDLLPLFDEYLKLFGQTMPMREPPTEALLFVDDLKAYQERITKIFETCLRRQFEILVKKSN